MESINNENIVDHKFIINDLHTGNKLEVKPKAVESCMVPGTFHITPITIIENAENIIYSVSDNKVILEKKKIDAGEIIVEKVEFKPVLLRRIGGCKPCTNCGRCSW